MAQVLLVRHAQASFAGPHYDKLSDLGLEQARRLGAALGPRLPRVDAVFTGTQTRHRQTAQACLAAAGITLVPQLAPGFDEFDFREVLDRYEMPAGEELDAIVSGAIRRWIGGGVDHEYREPWSRFRLRCTGALDDVIRALGPSTTSLVFTSGGPIAAICQSLLNVPDGHVPPLIGSLVNCGVTKVIFGASGVRLSTLNDHGHFEAGPTGLISYR
jgi:broad specificity phosphatase PhoE